MLLAWWQSIVRDMVYLLLQVQYTTNLINTEGRNTRHRFKPSIELQDLWSTVTICTANGKMEQAQEFHDRATQLLIVEQQKWDSTPPVL